MEKQCCHIFFMSLFFYKISTASNARSPRGIKQGICGWGSGVRCICLGWRSAVAGVGLQSQPQVIGSSVLMSIYLSCSEAGVVPCWCLCALAEYPLDCVMVHHSHLAAMYNINRAASLSRCSRIYSGLHASTFWRPSVFLLSACLP